MYNRFDIFDRATYCAQMNEETRFTGRLVGYMRVSTDEQEFALQRDALIRYGVPEDLIFSDKMTGSTMRRAGLRRAILICEPGDALVVWKLDRLGRSLVGVVEQLETLINAGIKVISVTDNIDYTSPHGKAMVHMTAVFAQLERDLISERTKAGIASFKARGGVMGRPHPILDRPNRRKKFQALFDTGALFEMTGQQIVDAINSVKEIETKGDNKGKAVKPMSLASWGNTKKHTIAQFLPKDGDAIEPE